MEIYVYCFLPLCEAMCVHRGILRVYSGYFSKFCFIEIGNQRRGPINARR